MIMSHPADRTLSKRFCAADSDVTFESCDKVLFKIHCKNLETHSEGFTLPDWTSLSNEIVPLSESAEVLDLLFQYIYPQRPPDLKAVDFKTLAAVAEAVEKYQVFAAMEICNILMEASYPEHPFEVMLYAMRHGYPRLMDVAQRTAIELSPAEAFGCCSPAVYIAWTRYHAQWVDILKYAHTFESPILVEHARHQIYGLQPDSESGAWSACVAETLRRLGVNVASLLDLDFTFEETRRSLESCGCGCEDSFSNWRSGLKAKIAEMPKFSTFL